MHTRLTATILVVLLQLAPCAVAQGDRELDRGLQLVKQGEYGQAIIVLDPVARRLGAASGAAQRKQAAQAYLNLGVAYVGEGQETLARESFREALRRDATIQLTAFDVSPKVRELFGQAREDLRQEALAGGTAPKKKGSGGKVLLIGGVLVAGGAAAAVAGGGGGGGDSGGGPSGNVNTIQLDSRTFILATNVHMMANHSCQNVSWDFGDGSTGTGGVVDHTYQQEGSFNVVARCESGGGNQGRATVTVRSVTGTYSGQSADGQGFTVHLTQSNNRLTGDVDGNAISGTVGVGPCQQDNSRCVNFATSCVNAASAFQGGVNDTQTTITGIGVLPCRFNFGFQPQTLTRQ